MIHQAQHDRTNCLPHERLEGLYELRVIGDSTVASISNGSSTKNFRNNSNFATTFARWNFPEKAFRPSQIIVQGRSCMLSIIHQQLHLAD